MESRKKQRRTRPKTAGPGRRSYIPKLYPPKPRPKSAGFKGDLSSSDLEFLTSETSFKELEIREWFKIFCKECPKGILTRKKVHCQSIVRISWNFWQALYVQFQMVTLYAIMGKDKPTTLVEDLLTIFDRWGQVKGKTWYLIDISRDRKGYLVFREFLVATFQSVSFYLLVISGQTQLSNCCLESGSQKWNFLLAGGWQSGDQAEVAVSGLWQGWVWWVQVSKTDNQGEV